MKIVPIFPARQTSLGSQFRCGTVEMDTRIASQQVHLEYFLRAAARGCAVIINSGRYYNSVDAPTLLAILAKFTSRVTFVVPAVPGNPTETLTMANRWAGLIDSKELRHIDYIVQPVGSNEAAFIAMAQKLLQIFHCATVALPVWIEHEMPHTPGRSTRAQIAEHLHMKTHAFGIAYDPPVEVKQLAVAGIDALTTCAMSSYAQSGLAVGEVTPPQSFDPDVSVDVELVHTNYSALVRWANGAK